MSHAGRLVLFALLTGLAHAAEPNLVVYLNGPLQELSALSEMKSEFAAVTLHLGWSTEWRELSQRTGSGEAAHSIVVRLNGNCSTTAEFRPVSTGEPLASVQEIEGRILPFVEVYCDVLVSTVAPAFINQPIYLRQTLLGRAMGRVLAHEVHHILRQTRTHSQQGINEARLQRHDLTDRAAPKESGPASFDAADSAGR